MTAREDLATRARGLAGIVAEGDGLARYAEIIDAPGEEKVPGCGLVAWRGILGPFLARPPSSITEAYRMQHAFSDPLQAALAADALVYPCETDGRPELGDVVLAAGPPGDAGHMWTVCEVDGDNYSGVDGGQRIGAHEAILEITRTLTREGRYVIERIPGKPSRKLLWWINLDRMVASYGQREFEHAIPRPH